MVSKWTVYFLTFASYATFHSIRSAWSGLKNMFYDPPFDYSVDFLGIMDMIVVFTLALSLSTLGHKVQRYGARKCLILGMSLLIVIVFIIGILLLKDVTSKALYVILYGFGIGIISATGWPSCLYLLSQYFDKKNNTALPIWNGTSQLGDFLALFISDIVIQGLEADVSFTLVIIPIIMIVILILNIIYLPLDKTIDEVSKGAQQLNEEKGNEEKSQSQKEKSSVKKIGVVEPKRSLQENLKDQIDQKDIDIKKQDALVIVNQKKETQGAMQKAQDPSAKENSIKETGSKLSQANLEVVQMDTSPVNFSNVWCLPGVTLYIMANAVIKSINVIIMTWLVFYLSLPEIDMKDESRIIAILWTLGVFGGGIIGGKVITNYSKKGFIACIMVSGMMFLTLQKLNEKIYEIEMAIAIVVSSLAFGIPYNMLNTAVPIMLGEKPEIKNRPGAKSTIISLMEGFGMGFCAFSILIVPLIGVDYIHLVLFVYSLVGVLILLTAIYMEKPHKNLPTDSNTERQQQKGSLC